MNDLDLLQHLGTIQNHIWILQQMSPYSELGEASQILGNLIQSLLNQNAIAPTDQS
jgi:hypothetical protein